jgi:hypothetical protein
MIHLTDDEARRLGFRTEVAHSSLLRAGSLNRTERKFRDEVLRPAWDAGRIAAFYREPIKFRIAGNTHYTPDFLVSPSFTRPSDRLIIVEVKGYMREDAAVKIKAAASLYPCFDWLVAFGTRRQEGWRVHQVTAHGGISRAHVVFPWDYGD